MDLVNEIFQAIDCPIWIKDKNNKIIFINENFKSSFDIEINLSETDINEYLKTRIDLNRLIEIIKKINGKSTEITNVNGSFYRHVVFSYDNKLANLAGMLIDVTDIKEENNEPHEKNVLKTVIDNIPELIFYKDKNLRYVGLNKECEKFYLDRGIDNVTGKTDLELPLDKYFIEACSKNDKMVLETREPLYIEETIPISDSDETGTMQTVKTPIINEDGSIWGLVGVVRDITDQKRVEEKLRYLSYVDTLTGLYNRAYFDEKIDEFIEDEMFPVGVITGDVNGLKIVNDTFGHIEGDKLLTAMSKVLKKACKDCDDKGLIFRWGGDEFVILLPKSSEKECAEVMNKVSELCNKEVYEKFRLSIAQGYSLLTKDNNIDEALRESENKVYKQKILDNKSIRSSILTTLRSNLQNKNVETEEHTERVAKHCLEVGKHLGLDDETMDKLLLVGKLHDIGKIGIPEHILLKTDRLADDEYEIMKTHSEKGYRLALLLPELSHISRAILTHHERWDGKGYPLGLKEEEIPLIARIVSVVDTFDSMTHDRVYSKAVSKTDAICELKNCAGEQFDPSIVEVFCNILEKM